MKIVTDKDGKIGGQTKDELNALIQRTNKANPKPEDVKLLTAWLDAAPSAALKIGNLQQSVFGEIFDKAVGHSTITREAAERYIKYMKTELGYQSSTFVEQMLIDEIIMRWLRLQVTESNHKEVTYGEHTYRAGMYVDKRLHLAQRRYLKAIETLVKVRKMIAQTQAKGAEMFKNLMNGA